MEHLGQGEVEDFLPARARQGEAGDALVVVDRGGAQRPVGEAQEDGLDLVEKLDCGCGVVDGG
ncbi:hypothetical protein OHA63_10200 [Streptomyces anulatus]|nr:hypothetical protein [Streptomyces anulatus]